MVEAVLDDVEGVLDHGAHLRQRPLYRFRQIPQGLRQGFDDAAPDLLSARTTLVRRLRDIENSVRGLLRGFGFRFPRVLRARWAQSVREALAGNPTLLAIIDPSLAAGAALRDQLAVLESASGMRRGTIPSAID